MSVKHCSIDSISPAECLGNTFIDAITIIGTRIASHLSDALVGEFGLGLNEWRTLCAVAEYPYCSIGTICKLTGIHKTIVSRALQMLSKKKFIHLKRRKRFVSVVISSEGNQFHARTLPLVISRKEILVAGLSIEETEMATAVLKKVQGNLSNV